jgi:hypothetical protein
MLVNCSFRRLSYRELGLIIYLFFVFTGSVDGDNIVPTSEDATPVKWEAHAFDHAVTSIWICKSYRPIYENSINLYTECLEKIYIQFKPK